MVANLLTMGNAVCGFIAIVLIGSAPAVQYAEPGLPVQFKYAVWLVFLGMAFDALDGRVARSTNTTSPLGAQLDSMADLTTFGLVPSVLMFHMNQLSPFWQHHRWILWCLCIAYFLGAVLRLARFSVETKPEESAHMCFRGLPTPGAAGLIASYMILYFYLQMFNKPEMQWFDEWKDEIQSFSNVIPLVLPFLGGLLGYTMVSNRLWYSHVAGRLLSRRTFDAFAYVTFGIVLLAVIPEVLFPVLFTWYLLTAPCTFLIDLLPGRKAKQKKHAGFEQR